METIDITPAELRGILVDTRVTRRDAQPVRADVSNTCATQYEDASGNSVLPQPLILE
jgi:hypothetical protein